MNIYFIFVSNNKYSTSFIFKKNFLDEKIFLENNKEIIKNYNEIIQNYSYDTLIFHNFKINKLNGFLSEGFCVYKKTIYILTNITKQIT